MHMLCLCMCAFVVHDYVHADACYPRSLMYWSCSVKSQTGLTQSAPLFHSTNATPFRSFGENSPVVIALTLHSHHRFHCHCTAFSFWFSSFYFISSFLLCLSVPFGLLNGEHHMISHSIALPCSVFAHIAAACSLLSVFRFVSSGSMRVVVRRTGKAKPVHCTSRAALRTMSVRCFDLVSDKLFASIFLSLAFSHFLSPFSAMQPFSMPFLSYPSDYPFHSILSLPSRARQRNASVINTKVASTNSHTIPSHRIHP